MPTDISEGCERTITFDAISWAAKRNLICHNGTVRRYISAYARTRIKEVFGETCFWCNRVGRTLDHFIPLSRGGRNVWQNMVPCCVGCNQLNASHLPVEADCEKWERYVKMEYPHSHSSQNPPPIVKEEKPSESREIYERLRYAHRLSKEALEECGRAIDEGIAKMKLSC